MTSMLEHTMNTNLTMNNVAPKLQKCWTHKIALKIVSKMLKQPHFFHSQPSTLTEEALAKFYLPTTFGLSFMKSSVASGCFAACRWELYFFLVDDKEYGRIYNRKFLALTGMTPVFTMIYQAVWPVLSSPRISQPQNPKAVSPFIQRPHSQAARALGLPVQSMYNHEWHFPDPNTSN